MVLVQLRAKRIIGEVIDGLPLTKMEFEPAFLASSRFTNLPSM